MSNFMIVGAKLQRKIENINQYEGRYLVKFKDLMDTFWFNTQEQLQEFLNIQARERFYDKELRKSYFDYINDANEVLRYYIKSNRGTLKVIKEENLGTVQ